MARQGRTTTHVAASLLSGEVPYMSNDDIWISLQISNSWIHEPTGLYKAISRADQERERNERGTNVLEYGN